MEGRSIYLLLIIGSAKNQSKIYSIQLESPSAKMRGTRCVSEIRFVLFCNIFTWDVFGKDLNLNPKVICIICMPSTKSLRIILYICSFILYVKQAFYVPCVTYGIRSVVRKCQMVEQNSYFEFFCFDAHFTLRWPSYLTVACEVICITYKHSF